MLLRYNYSNILNGAFGKGGLIVGFTVLWGLQELISQLMSLLAEQRIARVFDAVVCVRRWRTGGAG